MDQENERINRVVKYMLHKLNCASLMTAILLQCAIGRAQQQTPQEMQSQMALADSLQSMANTSVYKTPLKTFQKYYDNSKIPNLVEVFACMTERLRSEILQNQTPSNEELAVWSAQAQQSQFSNITLDLFIFTPNPQRPKITVLTSGTEKGVRVTEQIILLFIETSSGWKIDDENITTKSRAPAHNQ
jgi:hypothetical protein